MNKYLNELYLMYCNPLNWGFILRWWFIMGIIYFAFFLFFGLLLWLFGCNIPGFTIIRGVYSGPAIYIGDGVWL